MLDLIKKEPVAIKGNADGVVLVFCQDVPVMELLKITKEKIDNGKKAKEIKSQIDDFKLKTDYKTSVLLVHHYNKGSAGEERGGQKMLGSVVLHGWVASAWYIKTDAAGLPRRHPAAER